MPQPPGPRHPINLVVASFCDLMDCSIIPIKPESVAKWRCIKGVGHCSVESFMSIGWKDRDNLDEGSLWVWLQHRQTHGFDAGLSSLPCLNTSGFTAIMWRVSFQMATSIHQIQTFQAVTIAPIPSWPQLGNQTWQVPLIDMEIDHLLWAAFLFALVMTNYFKPNSPGELGSIWVLTWQNTLGGNWGLQLTAIYIRPLKHPPNSNMRRVSSRYPRITQSGPAPSNKRKSWHLAG